MRLEVEALALRRGGRLLFENLSFAANAGAYVELRGKNGAGKTSLLRALAGWLPPASGAIRFPGLEEPALAMHVLGHGDGLKAPLTPRAHVDFWARLLGTGKARAAPNVEKTQVGNVLTFVGLSAAADLPARFLSQGQQRRLALARLFAAPRPLWLLDEPSAALDAEGKALLANFIAAHARGGGIVIAAVHEPIGPSPDHVIDLSESAAS
ncbi:MAG: heme ABC exporter ATP-binding protein CcmA [Hyphomonadaceae bacterium]